MLDNVQSPSGFILGRPNANLDLYDLYQASSILKEQLHVAEGFKLMKHASTS